MTLLETKKLKEHYKNLNRENVSALYNYKSISSNLKSLKDNSSVLDLGGGIGEFAFSQKISILLF